MFFEERRKLFCDNTVVNWHEHVWFDRSGKLDEGRLELLMEHASLLGIDMTVVSLPLTKGFCTPEEVERANDAVIEAIKRYPDSMRGYVYVDPIMGRYALREIERCVENHGFIGIKLYHQFHMNDPEQYPIIEKSIELGIPVLMHAGKFKNILPYIKTNVTNAQHMIDAAKRYPEATFQMAHIGGGGDWYWQLKGVKELKNLFIDISGSVHDSGMIERTVQTFGAERILFASDGSYSSSVGKLLSAEISDENVKTILNNPHFARYLKK